MFNANDIKKWYALFVCTGEEDHVKERLQYKLKDRGLKIVVPKRKLRERKNGVWENKIRTLFPGYVLVNGCMDTEEYYSIKGTPGLISVLKDRSGILEIRDPEINVISRLICDNEIIGLSKVHIDNGRVIVVDGPLLGMDGLIESIDKRKGRVKVRLNFIGESRVVELSVSMIQPAYA